MRPPCTLPPLADVSPTGPHLPAAAHKSWAMTNVLRQIATAHRTNRAQPFYSLRDVASFYGVTHMLVAAAYAELEREGLLVCVRGSGTRLQPRGLQPRHPVRGIIGVPVWQYGYCVLADWRFFHVRLEEHLRRRHFVADFIFNSGAESMRPEFVDRLVSHELDGLFWFYPLPEHRAILSTLVDGGVPVVVLPDQGTNLPFPTYRVDWRGGARLAFADWRRDGIRQVVFVCQEGRAAAETRWLLPLAQAAGLKTLIHELPDELLPGLASRWRGRRDVGILIPEHNCCTHICLIAGGEMAALIRRHRVMVLNRVDLPVNSLAGSQLDVVCPNWDRIASRIADDIASKRISQQEPVRFAAAYHRRADATQFAHAF